MKHSLFTKRDVALDALIFDMDGVIVDSELHWKSLEDFFLKELIPSWTPADQARIIGISLPNLYKMLTVEYGMQKDEQEFVTEYHAMATQIYAEKAQLLPGFSQVLDDLRAQKMPLAIASSSPHAWIELVLSKFKLHSAFQVVASAEEIGGRGKPAPDIYLYTAKKLGVNPTHCAVIEDSRNGVLSAKSAGMFCIGIRNGFNDDQDISTADVIIDGYAELDLSPTAS